MTSQCHHHCRQQVAATQRAQMLRTIAIVALSLSGSPWTRVVCCRASRGAAGVLYRGSGTTHCMHRLWVASGSMTISPTHLMVGYLGYRRAVLSLAGRARGGCQCPSNVRDPHQVRPRQYGRRHDVRFQQSVPCTSHGMQAGESDIG